MALAIAVVVGLVFWVGSCQGKSRHDEYKSYMESIQPIAQSSASSLRLYAKALESPKLTLAQLRAKLNLWSRVQQEDYTSAQRLVPPATLQAPHQQVLATLQLRAIGLTGLADTLATAGSQPASKVGNRLAGQAQLLSASDIVWANLFRLPAKETLTRLGVIGVIAPPSQIVANPEVITASSFTRLYSRLKTTPTSTTGKVTGVHGSELLGTEAVSGGQTNTLSASGQNQVNVAADLVFKVSFKNSGNFDQVHVPVTFTVSTLQKKVFSKQKFVPSILKGQTATVPFGNLDLPTSVFGANATVTVEIGKVPGEVRLDNNKASYAVFFSLPSGG